jgi:hypothetical protein
MSKYNDSRLNMFLESIERGEESGLVQEATGTPLVGSVAFAEKMGLDCENNVEDIIKQTAISTVVEALANEGAFSSMDGVKPIGKELLSLYKKSPDKWRTPKIDKYLEMDDVAKDAYETAVTDSESVIADGKDNDESPEEAVANNLLNEYRPVGEAGIKKVLMAISK